MKTTLRIAVIAHLKHAIREPFAGGLEMHTSFLCRGLRARGHRVTLFAAHGSDPEGLQGICREMHDDRSSFAAEHAVYLDLLRSFEAGGFDVLHNNSLHYLPMALAATVPVPMVTTLHTPPFWELVGAVRLSLTPYRHLVAVSRSIRRAWDAVTAVSEIIGNGIDLEQFAFHETPDRERYGIWFGRIVPEKGLHLAIDAARSIDLPLRIAGPISDPAYFEQQIRPRLHRGTRYLGHLPHGDLIRCIGGARVFLCTPLWEEPYGLVVAESLACGTPVAAFSRGALPELLDASCGALSDPGDIAGLAKAATYAQTLDRRACRARAYQVGNAENMIDAYERLYHSVIGSHPPVPTDATFNIDLASIAPSSPALQALYSRRDEDNREDARDAVECPA